MPSFVMLVTGGVGTDIETVKIGHVP